MAQETSPRSKYGEVSSEIAAAPGTSTIATVEKVGKVTRTGANTMYKCVGTVPNSGSTMISETSFAAKSGFSYKPFPTIIMQNLKYGGYDYSNHYSTKIVPTYTENRITSFKAQIFYNPPQDRFLFPDPSQFDNFNHCAFVDFEIQKIEQPVENTITHVSHKHELSRFAQETLITVHGAVGAQYDIQVTQQTSTTNSIPATSGHYDFDGQTFTTFNRYSKQSGAIGSDGKNNHFVRIPSVTSKTIYNVILTAVEGATLHANVPTSHGKAKITQYGIQSLNIEGVSYGSTIQGKEQSVSRPTFIPSINQTIPDTMPILISAGNDNSSSTVITLETENKNIQIGMHVLNLTPAQTDGKFDSTASGVTVSKIQGRTITLSNAVTVPNGTELRFEKDTNNLTAIDLTISGTTNSRTLYLTQQPTISDIGGLKDVSVLTDGAVQSSTTVTLDSTAGIVPGMVITAKDDLALAAKEINVSSITNATTLVLSDAVILADDTRLTFTGSNKGIEVLDIHAYIENGKVRVKGMLKIKDIQDMYIDGTLQTAAIMYIYLDNFIVGN
jgi:hypothetical protein